MALNQPLHRRWHSRGKTLAIGFGTTIAMWAICYVSMINPGLLIGELLFTAILLCILAAGFLAGRSVGPGESTTMAGMKVGFVIALLNLLIVGALLIDPHTHRLQPHAGLWIAGDLIGSIVLAMLGAMFASRFARKAQPDTGTMAPRHEGTKDFQLEPPSAPLTLHALQISPDWYSRFICVAAVAVFLLLITGGLVTGLRAGLAVPDWPTSFGHNMLLYPLAEMSGGKYFEHAHRLYGMLVGVTAITVALSMFWFDARAWIRILAVTFLLMVIGQGLLGGPGRVLQREIWYAIVHGAFGQIIFATIIALAAFTSARWKSNAAATFKPSAGTDRALSTILVCLLIVQLILGALYRHLNREWNIPPEPLHLLFTHIFVAILVILGALVVGGRALSVHRDQPVLPGVGKILLNLLGIQLLLGISAMIAVWSRDTAEPIPIFEVIITTAHQATGALLLATSTVMMLWMRRLLTNRQAASASAIEAKITAAITAGL